MDIFIARKCAELPGASLEGGTTTHVRCNKNTPIGASAARNGELGSRPVKGKKMLYQITEITYMLRKFGNLVRSQRSQEEFDMVFKYFEARLENIQNYNRARRNNVSYPYFRLDIEGNE